MNPNDENMDESARMAKEVDKSLAQENPAIHIEMNKNEAQLHPQYVCGLWTQITKLTGINTIDTNSSQLIIYQEDHEAFLTIVTALH